MNKCIIIIIMIIICENIIIAQKIELNVKNQHPFLVDHDRILLSYDSNNDLIDSVKISPFTGSQINASIFENDSTYIIIDGNGLWIYLSKKTNEFYSANWEWNKDLPLNYIGTFCFKHRKNNYFLLKKELRKNDVYQIKDPTDYSNRFLKPVKRRKLVFVRNNKKE